MSNKQTPYLIKNYWLMLLLAFCGIGILGFVILSISIYGFRNKMQTSTELSQYVGEAVGDPVFELSLENSALKVGTANKLIVTLDTKGKTIDAGQVVLRFDTDKIRVDNAEKGSIPNFDGFTIDKQESGKTMVIVVAPLTPNYSFNGRQVFAKVLFTPLKTDSSSVNLVCDGVFKSKVSREGANLLACSGSLTFNNITSDTSTGTGGVPTPTPNLSQPSKSNGCDKENPARPTNLKAVTGSNAGQVKLTWTKSANADHYAIVFGEKWQDFTWGDSNIGDTDQYLVKGLRPGALNYFAIAAVNGCASSGISDGASAYAGKVAYTYSGGNAGTTSVIITPKPTTNPYTYITPAPTVASTALPTYAPTFYESSSSAVDDETAIWENLPSASPEATTETESTKGNLLLTLAKILPWIGLGVLLILGIMLFKFIRGGNDQELPPLPGHIETEDDQLGGKTSDPMSPPFSS